MSLAPIYEIFFVTSATTGLPLTGAAGAMSFANYTNEAGSVLTPPAISEIGGGFYKFSISYASPSHGVVYSILTTGSPAYVYRYARPTDYSTDLIPDLHTIAVGKWSIATSGGNANTLILYDLDGTTVLYKFNLLDSSGNPTSTAPFTRVPV